VTKPSLKGDRQKSKTFIKPGRSYSTTTSFYLPKANTAYSISFSPSWSGYSIGSSLAVYYNINFSYSLPRIRFDQLMLFC